MRVCVLFLLVACSSSPVGDGSNSGGPGNSDGNSGSTAGSNTSGASTGGSTSGGSSTSGGTTTSMAGNVLTAKIGTYISLGDSISDLGGTGPFFYDLLLNNDNTTYPSAKGHDLTTRFPGITYDHRALAGSITDNYVNGPLVGPTLKSQIDLLGTDYPGDILVTITIGGNDLQGHALSAIDGSDGPAQMELGQHLDDELAELLAPGRLGTGHVYVVMANIYDFTDGQGDFATVLCGPPVNLSAAQDATIFGGWNGVMQTAISKAGIIGYDMHADFMGHGFEATDVWFDRISCIHPNATGHDAIRRAIWKLVTGETI